MNKSLQRACTVPYIHTRYCTYATLAFFCQDVTSLRPSLSSPHRSISTVPPKHSQTRGKVCVFITMLKEGGVYRLSRVALLPYAGGQDWSDSIGPTGDWAKRDRKVDNPMTCALTSPVHRSHAHRDLYIGFVRAVVVHVTTWPGTNEWIELSP